jgi:hypothetical protein
LHDCTILVAMLPCERSPSIFCLASKIEKTSTIFYKVKIKKKDSIYSPRERRLYKSLIKRFISHASYECNCLKKDSIYSSRERRLYKSLIKRFISHASYECNCLKIEVQLIPKRWRLGNVLREIDFRGWDQPSTWLCSFGFSVTSQEYFSLTTWRLGIVLWEIGSVWLEWEKKFPSLWPLIKSIK